MTDTTKGAGRTIGELAEESNRLFDRYASLREEHEKMKARFQDTCTHTYGSMFDGKTNNICPNCLWDKDKCQHKVSRQRCDKFCSECGVAL